jgi:HEAT repeat protein
MWALAFAFVVIQHSTTDPELLAQVLRDRSADEQTKQQAALDLGCLGGDRAVRYLETALRGAGPDTRASIALALGNTRSRLAVPVLITMFADDSAREEVCDALVTLTHRTWCDGGDDDAALRRAWRRWWSQMKSSVEIHGPDRCEADVRANLSAGR